MNISLSWSAKKGTLLVAIGAMFAAVLFAGAMVASAARTGVDLTALSSTTVEVGEEVSLEVTVSDDGSNEDAVTVLFDDNAGGGTFTDCSSSVTELVIDSGVLSGNLCYSNDTADTYTITIDAQVEGVSIGTATIDITVENGDPITNTTSGDTFTSIQDAVDAALEGETIEVGNGTYEPFGTSLGGPANVSIVAADGATPRIEGSASRLVDLRADGTTLRGFTIESTSVGSGVGVSISGQGIAVEDNTIVNVLTGIQTTTQHESGSATITNNVIESTGVGISLQNNNNTVTDNSITVTGTDYEGLGIGSTEWAVTGNAITGNTFDVAAGGNVVKVYSSADGYGHWDGSDFVATDFVANNTIVLGVYVEGGLTIYTDLVEAVDASAPGDTIRLLSDVETSEQITINHSFTLDGNGHTISPNFTKTSNSNNSAIGIIGTSDVTIQDVTIDGEGGTDLHGINVYESTGVHLQDVTSKDHDRSGVSVNSSAVTVENISTSGNGWHGINVDQKTALSSSLVVNGISSHDEALQIFIDDISLDVSVTDTNSQYDIAESLNPNPDYTGATMRVYTLVEVPSCSSDDSTFDTFEVGNVDGQNDWRMSGPYDQSVVRNTYGYSEFGCKSLRVSNAVTSGSFGDWIHTPAMTTPIGETDSDSKDIFEVEFDIATVQFEEQTGLQVSVAPDDGEGARMSYLKFEDQTDGVHVIFNDVQSTAAPVSWTATDIATLARGETHTIKLTLQHMEGMSNDIVKVYVDGDLVHTGTSWENYYWLDTSGEVTEHVPPMIDSLIIQARGNGSTDNHSELSGKGFLFDNVTLSAYDAETPSGSGSVVSGSRGGSRGNNNDDDANDNTGTPVGQVLGATTIAAGPVFTSHMGNGASGGEVSSLQAFLIARGYLQITAPTGYFGPMTEAALKLYQASKGIPATGYFGPITLAAINAEQATPVAAQIAALQAQLEVLVKELQALLNAQN